MIEVAKEAAFEAGKILRQILGNIRQIETKNNQESNLVTDADTAAETKIIEIIHSRYPDHQILSEEKGSFRSDSEFKWIIDPLDGTTNYTHAFPVFSVSIGIELRGEMIAGIVYDPMRNEMFHAEKGKGAYLNEKPIRVSQVSAIEKAMLVTGFPYNIKQNPHFCTERFVAFLHRAQAVRRLGSAAIDCAYIAAGRLDGYWEVSLHPWDKAAGQLLVTEAGGTVTNFEGGPHDLYAPPILASNGRIHDIMVEILELAKRYIIQQQA
jgi:myo-inositol-1(or 4)-monophosphatase